MYYCYSILCLSVYLPLLASCIFSLLCVVVQHPFVRTWRNPFSILVGSYSDDELPQLFFFFKHGKVLFFLHFSSTTFFFFFFATYSALGWQFSPFSTLNISSHCLLACRVPAEKFTDSIMGLLLCMVIHFSLVAYRTTFAFVF